MDRGGKSENIALKELTLELEHFLNVTTQKVNVIRQNVYEAKEVKNILPCKLTCRNELEKSSVSNPLQNSISNEYNSSDEELALEGEIRRILQVAEKIRDATYAKHNKKPSMKNYSAEERKENLQKKERVVSSTKTIHSEVTQKHSSAFLKSPKRKTGSSHLKTTYRQDFSLKKGKSMPSLNKISKASEKELISDKCTKKKSLPVKNQISSTASSARLTEKLSSLTVKRMIDNSNHTSNSFSMKKNEDCNRNSHELSVPFKKTNLNESFLSEEILLRSQTPNCRYLLSGLREYHAFMNESKRKIQKEEIRLEENFLKKCNVSEKIKQKTQNDLESIFESLVPHCSCVLGGDQSFTSLNLNCIKDAVIKSEEKLKHIMCHNQKGEIEPNDPCNTLEFPELEWKSRNLENWNSNEFSLWNLAIIPLIFKEKKDIPYIHYNSVHEWVSFKNSIHELQEYHLQLKIIEHIHPIISQFFHLQESNQNKVDRYNAKDQKASIALVLKTMATIADFSGHLTIPILASLSSDNLKQNTMK